MSNPLLLIGGGGPLLLVGGAGPLLLSYEAAALRSLPHNDYDQTGYRSLADTSGRREAADERLREARRAIGLTLPDPEVPEIPPVIPEPSLAAPPSVQARILPDLPPFDATRYAAVFSTVVREQIAATPEMPVLDPVELARLAHARRLAADDADVLVMLAALQL